MALTVSNQQLSMLKPYYVDDVSKPYDSQIMRKCLTELIAPIWTPLQAQYPVEIEDDNQKILSNDDILDIFQSTMGDTRNAGAEDDMNSLWKATLAYYTGGLTANEVFSAQAAAKSNIPAKLFPSPTVIYTADDLKKACVSYIASNKQDDSEIVANAAFFMNEPCLMFHFLSKFTFQDFKAYVMNIVNALGTNLTADTKQKFNDFSAMTFDTIEGLILRRTDAEELDEYSFARILVKCALDYANQSADCGVIAPYVDELLIPRNLVFLDVDKISKSPRDKLKKALNDVKDGIKIKYKPMSLNKISKLSAAATSKRRMVAQIKQHQQLMTGGGAGKRVAFKFKRVAMTKTDLSKYITKIIKKEVNVSASENYAKVIKSSYLRPNRRQPDNYNLPGKSISMQYKPDIHIYIDTSGSISEDNYKEAILTLITMAKKLDVNLYFNSFSHVISKQTKLQVKGKTVDGIYREFQRVPKVTGGTNFSLVWDYIMKSPKRQKEISLMITDFEWSPPSKRPDYPPKLYYAPIATSPRYWSSMVSYAEEFCKNMYHIDKNIRKKILMK